MGVVDDMDDVDADLDADVEQANKEYTQETGKNVSNLPC